MAFSLRSGAGVHAVAFAPILPGARCGKTHLRFGIFSQPFQRHRRIIKLRNHLSRPPVNAGGHFCPTDASYPNCVVFRALSSNLRARHALTNVLCEEKTMLQSNPEMARPRSTTMRRAGNENGTQEARKAIDAIGMVMTKHQAHTWLNRAVTTGIVGKNADDADRVPRRGVTGGGAPRSPARAGPVSWR
jgi:hypothetical protein